MKITLESKMIPLSAEKVFSYFDENLFKALNPWFIPMKVILVIVFIQRIMINQPVEIFIQFLLKNSHRYFKGYRMREG
jgi:hypothetical protein